MNTARIASNIRTKLKNTLQLNEPTESFIAAFHAMEKPILLAFKDLDADLIDKNALIAGTIHFFNQLNNLLGFDLLRMTPSELTREQKSWAQSQLVEYNYQLRFFYAKLLMQLKEKNLPEAAAITLSQVLTSHSLELEKLFNQCQPAPVAVSAVQAEAQVIVMQAIPSDEVILIDSEVKSDNHSFSFGFSSYHPRTWHHNTLGGFWNWQGFNAGYNNQRPDRFMLFFNSDYNHGYWQGRETHFLVDLFDSVIRNGAHLAVNVANDFTKLASFAGKEFLVLGKDALNIGESAIRGCAQCGGSICNCLSSSYSAICNIGNSLSGDLCSCGRGLADCCGSCLSECGSVIGSLGNCAEKVGEDCVKVVGSICTALGTAATFIANTIEKFAHHGSSDNSGTAPAPPVNNTITFNGTNVSHVARFGARSLLATADDSFAGTSLAGLKITMALAYFAVFGVREFINIGRNIRNIGLKHKINENAMETIADLMVGLIVALPVTFIPLIGGPHNAIILSIAAMCVAHHYSEKKVGQWNIELYGDKNPDQNLMKHDALMKVCSSASQEQKEFSPFQIQQGLEVIKGLLHDWKHQNLREKNFMHTFSYRFWTVYADPSPRERFLQGALTNLQMGNFEGFKEYCKLADINALDLFKAPEAKQIEPAPQRMSI